jgi:hypothetical protein
MTRSIPSTIAALIITLTVATAQEISNDNRDQHSQDAAPPPKLAIAPLPKSKGFYRIPYADGTDVKVSRDHNTHTPPGRYDLVGQGGKPHRVVAAAPGKIVAIENSFSATQDSKTAPQCNNNYVWIEHPNGEWTKYSHMVKNSTVVKAGLKEGDIVKAGQYLGDEGAVGCASGDHLHFEIAAVRETNPFNLIGGFVNDNAGSKRNRIARVCSVPSGMFVAGQVNKARNVPTMLTPGSKEVARHGLPIEDYQCLFDQAVSANYEPVWIDMFDVGGDTRVNAIFRPKTPGDMQAFHGLTGAQYQGEFDKWTGKGYRPVIVESYLDNGVRYAAVFKKTNGPEFAAYHGVDAAAHQNQLDTLTAKGFRPVSISVVSNGGRRYTALYEKKNVGGWQAKSQLTPNEYQTLFNENKQAGRGVAYLNAYHHDGDNFIVAIWTSQTSTNGKQRHGLTGAQYQDEWESATNSGMLTRAVTGYATGNTSTYAASWRP